ncbi:diaminopropionate ammonia-lyase [Kiloniella laminariae]|uniref:Diaminopropionate ammonia-lyase n=1 Tax=Kiloniella laminariae TaxID=454162 RepID=A0ABT4LEU3_9PROT|nr:diaminopropionate ammonia-lyase [Kiloniella laminariae]MCZ4279607.1 diaminopropionate ammonia-lyase [Kiloniella laminariae]
MSFDIFDQAALKIHHNPATLGPADYPAALQSVLGVDDCTAAKKIITGWQGYSPSPLTSLSDLATALDIDQILYKDEAQRFGLGSFKALGGAYAVLCLLQQQIRKLTGKSIGDHELASGNCRELTAGITVITATDGNHGRSVAWGAKKFGCPCKIYMHAGVSKGRAAAVEELGAEVVWVEGNYDASVRAAANDASKSGWFVVSDTSYDGYMDLPRNVMAGYSVMTSEIIDDLAGKALPSHVFLQGGVGGLAGAVCAHLWQAWGKERPRFIVVEPEQADCLYQSAQQGRPTAVDITEETVMAGLSCGEVSLLGWKILSQGCHDFITLDDSLVGPSMRLLASGEAGNRIVAGESAVAGLAGAIAACRQTGLRNALGLDKNSRIMVIGTEGATDPAIYQSLVGQHPDSVL